MTGTDLSVSADGHHLTKDGVPFLYISEQLWYLPQRSTRANVDTLLDGLDGTTDPEKGCTTVIQFANVMAATESPPVVENPTNLYSHQAFNGGTVPDFTDPKVVAGGTPDAPNDYWDHLDYIVREIGARGMYLIMMPQWSVQWVNGGQGFTPITAADARSYGEFLGNRYKDDGHILWMLGGDGLDPAVEGTTAIYRAQAEGILKGVTGCTTCPTYNEASALWNQVLMSYHATIQTSASDFWDINEKWCRIDGCYAGRHYTIKPAYELANPRPIIETEGYGFWSMTEDQQSSARLHQYVHYLSGGRGCMFMNEFMWDLSSGWETRLAVAERKQFTLVRDNMAAIEWWKLIPDNTIIMSANSPSEENFKQKMVAAKSSSGDTIMVFFSYASPKTSQIDLNAITTNQSITGTWINTINGTTQSAGTHDVDDNPTFTVPATWTDGLLKLQGASPYTRRRGILHQKPPYNQIGGRFR
jgi:hypothetical protein